MRDKEMHKMQVYMISSYPSQACGISKYSERLIEALEGNGIIVNKKTIFFHRNPSQVFRWFPFLMEIIRNRPDVVQIQYTPTICGPLFPLFLYIAKKTAKDTGVVVTSHEKPGVYEKHLNRLTLPLFRSYTRSILKSSDWIIVLSGDHAEELSGSTWGRKDGITVVPHGVDRRRDTSPEQVEALKRRYEIGGNIPITFFGGIRPNKGIEYLIQAFVEVAGCRDDLLLIIAGDIQPRQEDYAESLKDMACRLAIEDRVRFTGYVEEDDRAAIMAVSALLVLPYIEVTQSAVLYNEAISYSKPVIVTAVGEMAQTVEENRLGEVVNPKDIDALAGAIISLADDQKRLRHYAENARKLGETLSWQSIASAHIRIYERLSAP